MKPRIVIVGAGLGGCYLAAGLVDLWHVTLIELADQPPHLGERVKDVALPAVTDPHISSGFGGTSKVWHNGLMEVDEVVFDEKWPFPKAVLDPYYERAYLALSGVKRQYIDESATTLREKLQEIGLPKSCLSQSLFYPSVRVNAWNTLKLDNKVERLEGEVTELIADGESVIRQVRVRGRECEFVVEADVFVLAAGGLGSPLLLQKLAKSLPLPSLEHAGAHYEDHPSAFVGEVVLDKPLYKLWNYPVRSSAVKGNLRLPLSIRWNGLNISFQLRPAAHFWMSPPRTRVVSVLSDLRNNPTNPRNYWRFLAHSDDILELLSIKFGLRLPTRHYSLLMVAEQPPSPYCAVWKDDNRPTIYRRWEADEQYINTINGAISYLLGAIRGIVKQSRLFPNWPDQMYSSSHHSGTARLSHTPDDGVCDLNGKVHGVSNLFVCDGSIIPGSGFANTGLTIVALAMRMADHLCNRVFQQTKVTK